MREPRRAGGEGSHRGRIRNAARLGAALVAVAALLGPVPGDERDAAAADPEASLVRTLHRPTPTPTSSTTTTAVASEPVPVTQAPVEPPLDPYANEPLVVLGTMEIPKIGVAAPLHQGISLKSIDRGPSHWPGTALPGQVGNAVIAGHRVTRTRPFRNIDQLVPGDEVIFTVGGVRWAYVVTGHEVVTPDGFHILDPTPTATATLFACHPPGSARYRYVVHLALSEADFANG